MASPQIPFISVPCKKADDIDWVKPLKRHIALVYQDDPEKYNEETTAINILRQNALAAGNDNAGRDLLYRYFSQLELLDLHFQVDEKNVKIQFTWYDAFDGKDIAQYSLAYEKASVLFNIAATLSAIAALQNRAEAEGRKRACVFLQTAAGTFQYINDNFLHAPSKDLSKETVQMLAKLMLAQAQECFLESSVSENKKESLVAKLASHASWAYGSLADDIQENTNRGAGISGAWLTMCQLKHKYYQAFGQQYKAKLCEKENKYGELVARFLSAETAAKEATKLASNLSSMSSNSHFSESLPMDSGSTMQELTKSLAAVCNEQHKKAEHENDMIYHESVPQVAILTPIDRLNAVKTTSITDLYGKNNVGAVVGPDIFARLIPLSVHESESIYSEEKAKLLRSITEKCNLAEAELSTSLHDMKLPETLQRFKSNSLTTVPEEVRNLADIIAVEESTSATNIDDLMNKINASKSEVVQTLNQVESNLQQENREWEAMRMKHDEFWSQPHSAPLSDAMFKELFNYRSSLEKAAVSDDTLSQRHSKMKRDIDILAQGGSSKSLQDLFATLSSSLPEGQNSLLDVQVEAGNQSDLGNKVSEAEALIDKLRKIEKDRKETLQDLSEMAHKDDDISQILLINKKANVEQQIFEKQLEKYVPHQQRINESIRQQQELVKQLADTIRLLLKDQDALRLQTHSETLVKRLGQAKEGYFEIRQKLGEGVRFYTSLSSAARALYSKADKFTRDRARDRERITFEMENKSLYTPRMTDGMTPSAPSAPSAPPSIPEIEHIASQMSLQSPNRQTNTQTTPPINQPYSAFDHSSTASPVAYKQQPPINYSAKELFSPEYRPMQHHESAQSASRESSFATAGYPSSYLPLQYGQPTPTGRENFQSSSQQQPWSTQHQQQQQQQQQLQERHWNQQQGRDSLMD